MDKWEGKVAVVTGASSGIGQATAIALAQHGMNVAALARREDRLQEMEEKHEGKGCIKGYKCDVSKANDIEEVFKKIKNEMGKISVLVNNAGISFSTEIIDFEMDHWRQMFDVNVLGMFHCIKQLIESVKVDNDLEPMHIININSISGHHFSDITSCQVYSATKVAVTLLTKGLLKGLAVNNLKNIRLTSVSPGVVDTEIFDVGGWNNFNPKEFSHLTPQEIANSIVHVLSVPLNVVVSEMTVRPVGEVIL